MLTMQEGDACRRSHSASLVFWGCFPYVSLYESGTTWETRYFQWIKLNLGSKFYEYSEITEEL